MELILLEKVLNLGDLGDKVSVKSGFGRNFLVPQGKAVPATAENVARFETMRAELEKAAADKLGSAQSRSDALAEVTVEMAANASEEGKLYGSIGPREIADALQKMGHDVSKREVIMGEGPIRVVGEYDVQLILHADVDTSVKVVVSPE
ncbi:50S ribosomal protein L9 [Elongatibacter sediminis]|uniref:Large ribosomal subunit protein bL9 n=1 Tax=Elongatibacter sediminis TaxID=3119006 RepID=A0AAW9RC18_9GAMM